VPDRSFLPCASGGWCTALPAAHRAPVVVGLRSFLPRAPCSPRNPRWWARTPREPGDTVNVKCRLSASNRTVSVRAAVPSVRSAGLCGLFLPGSRLRRRPGKGSGCRPPPSRGANLRTVNYEGTEHHLLWHHDLPACSTTSCSSSDRAGPSIALSMFSSVIASRTTVARSTETGTVWVSVSDRRSHPPGFRRRDGARRGASADHHRLGGCRAGEVQAPDRDRDPSGGAHRAPRRARRPPLGAARRRSRAAAGAGRPRSGSRWSSCCARRCLSCSWRCSPTSGSPPSWSRSAGSRR